MTVIVGLVAEGVAWLGADSCGVDDNGRRRPGGKLLRLPVGDGCALLAHAGEGALKLVVRHGLTTEAPEDAGSLDGWAQALAVASAELALDHKPPITDGDGGVAGHSLLAYSGRLWHLAQGCAESAAGPVAAIGSGSDYALGALTVLLHQGLAPGALLHTALAAACEWQVDCAPPFDWDRASDVPTP